MWFILVRPAQKRQKATQEMQNNLKRGDKVVTIGGLHGEVDALEDSAVYLLVDGKTRLKFERQAIGRVIND
ncbi:preprotein translocase subunit YajC [compost metagenome]